MNLKSLLICPYTKQKLRKKNNSFVTEDGNYNYEINKNGIPLFYIKNKSRDAQIQKEHYDNVAELYQKNLEYSHTKEYMSYLDKEFLKLFKKDKIEIMIELCCGSGEAIKLLDKKYSYSIGIDISEKMLEFASKKTKNKNTFFLQGDALKTPLKDDSVDCVTILGGIHHLNDRISFFKEVNRILKPNGTFFWREPVDDFILWRLIRKVIYRLSPVLDHETESPLRYDETLYQLEKSGLEIHNWRTIGFFGFCFFMNSDVLWFNRFFRFLPFIRKLTWLSTKVDHFITSLKYMNKNGLIVIGSAKKKLNNF